MNNIVSKLLCLIVWNCVVCVSVMVICLFSLGSYKYLCFRIFVFCFVSDWEKKIYIWVYWIKIMFIYYKVLFIILSFNNGNVFFFFMLGRYF